MPNSHPLFGGRPAADAHDRRRNRRAVPRASAARQPAGLDGAEPRSASLRARGPRAPRMIPSRYPGRRPARSRCRAGRSRRGLRARRLDQRSHQQRARAPAHASREDEWVTGEPMASVVMAAYCHPRPGGGRFSTEERGAWYAGRSIDDRARRVRLSPHRRTARGRRLRDRACRCASISLISRARFHDIRAREPRLGAALRPGRLRRVPGARPSAPATPAPTASSIARSATRTGSASPASGRRWSASAGRRPLRVPVGRASGAGDPQALTV